VPSLGPLTFGHTLLVPANHVYSLADWEDPGHVQEIVGEALDVMRRSFGRTVTFEHGTRSPNSEGGCGIRHAHLHLVPTRIRTGLPPAFEWIGLNRDDWASLIVQTAPDLDYLMYWEPESEPSVALTNSVRSQVLREFVAVKVGLLEWDWRRAPRAAGLAEVSAKLEAALTSSRV
jgi:diadenosine tetraphosphate (Ap4A) HIT family hydrolase